MKPIVATIEDEFGRIEQLMRELRKRIDIAAEVARVTARKAAALEVRRKTTKPVLAARKKRLVPRPA